MRILIDISHIAHINFLKNTILELKKRGHEIFICYLDRGPLKEIVKKEFEGFSITEVGRHRNTKYSIIVDANIRKVIKLIFFIRKHKIDLGIGMGSFTMAAALRVNFRKSYLFDDDPERKLSVFLSVLFCTVISFPPIIAETRKIKTYNAIKEWSYLSPGHFSPNEGVLNNYNLKRKGYIFVREVSNKTLNYTSQADNLLSDVSRLFPENIPVVFSLENKLERHLYPSKWILLKEPVEDIHSLIYYSRLLISSGDSMAREAAVLGISSVYCGIREMKVNDLLIQKKLLNFLVPDEIPGFIRKQWKDMENSEEKQKLIRHTLDNEWEDVMRYIFKLIKEQLN